MRGGKAGVKEGTEAREQGAGRREKGIGDREAKRTSTIRLVLPPVAQCAEADERLAEHGARGGLVEVYSPSSVRIHIRIWAITIMLVRRASH